MSGPLAPVVDARSGQCRGESPLIPEEPVIALVFTETIGANQGIGYLVSQADSLQQIPVLVVCVVIYALLGIGADLLVRLLERVAMPWRRHSAVR